MNNYIKPGKYYETMTYVNYLNMLISLYKITGNKRCFQTFKNMQGD